MKALTRGFKNAFRNVVRSIGIIVILGLVVALAISMAIARGAVNQKINQVRGSTGNTISVSPAGFYDFHGGGTPLSTSDLSKLSSIPDVRFVRQSFSQLLANTSSTSSSTGSGFIVHTSSGTTSLKSSVTPGSLGQQFGGVMSTLPVTFTGTNSPGTALVGGQFGGGTEKLVSGTTFPANSNENVAIVGKQLASANGLSVGSTFTAWNISIKVVGIYDAGSTFANDGVLMPILSVQRLAGATGEVTNATVVVNSVDNVSTVTKEVKAQLGSKADVTNTQQIVESELSPLKSVKTISTYTLFGAVIAAGLILLLSMVMIVRERRREIGVLKAIGASNRSVVTQFISESLTFTILGSIVGLILGIVLSNPITNALVSSNASTSSTSGGPPGGGGFIRPGGFGGSGISTFTPGSGGGHFHFGGGFHGLSNTITQVHAAASWSTLLTAFLAAVVIAVIGSTVAVANVVRVRPAEVLRSE